MLIFLFAGITSKLECGLTFLAIGRIFSNIFDEHFSDKFVEATPIFCIRRATETPSRQVVIA